MAPPLVKGRAAVRQRLAGLVFLVVIALLVSLTVALYQKRFTPTVDVLLRADRAGNQLSVHADVKLRGIVVGEVRRISSHGDGADVALALQPGRVKDIPRNVLARLLPKTLFGEKEVDLVLPALPDGRHLARGDVIAPDRTSTGLETETALNDLLPLLQSLRPQELSMTLNAFSDALRGRGDRIGRNAVLTASYLRRLNPELPVLAQDMRGLADATKTYADATPDLLRVLDNFSANSRSLVQEQASLDSFLRRSDDFAGTLGAVLKENERRFVDLARDSAPSLDVYAKYSPEYPCLLSRIVVSQKETERTFGGNQPGLHITLEVVQDQGAYVPGDEPKYKERSGPSCYGLGPTPIVPFPIYANAQDGYRDGAPPENPGTGPNARRSSWRSGVGSPQRDVVSLPGAVSTLTALLVTPMAGTGLA